MTQNRDILSERKTYSQGIISAVGSGLVWGVMPIYWQSLKPIDSFLIIFYRIVLVAAVCLIGALIYYDKETIIAPAKDKKLFIKMILAGFMITINWSVYIWAVNANFVIQTCIGYYIEPLVICAFGIVLFKDKLSIYKIIALVMAVFGVAAVILYFGEIPLLALSLAVSFSVYTALKKGINLPPLISLLYETVFLMPFALVLIMYLEITGHGALAVAEPYKFVLLLFCGFCTALPLGLFSNAANKLNMFVLGLLSYISPTISLIIGILVLGEPFEMIQLVAFVIIWIGLGFFSFGEYKEVKEMRMRDGR